MFGTKIRSWMEAQLARSRSKRNNKEQQQQRNKNNSPPPLPIIAQRHSLLYRHATSPYYETTVATFFDSQPPDDFDEIRPALPISPSSFKPRVPPGRKDSGATSATMSNATSNSTSTTATSGVGGSQQQQQVQNKLHSAVNLSSPESAYSTGYSTDGTSPCATYAPEQYIGIRQQQQKQQHSVTTTTSTAVVPVNVVPCTVAAAPVKGRRSERYENGNNNTGTYTQLSSVSRCYSPPEPHPWRKPEPPSRVLSCSATSSPKIHHHQHYNLRQVDGTTNSYNNDTANNVATGGDGGGGPATFCIGPRAYPGDYPAQLFSPRTTRHCTAATSPLVAPATSTQVMPIKSPRQRSRPRTSPWQQPQPQSQLQPVNGRAWARQQQQQQQNYYPTGMDHCYNRQESLSVGRSPVNRASGNNDWRRSNHNNNNNGGSSNNNHQRHRRRSSCNSSNSPSCSSSRSCSLSSNSSASSSSSSSSSSSGSSGSSSSGGSSSGNESSDEVNDDLARNDRCGVTSEDSEHSTTEDVTLNELMGKYDENYLYEKETDLVSSSAGSIDRRTTNGCVGRNSSTFNVSSAATTSSLSSLEYQLEDYDKEPTTQPSSRCSSSRNNYINNNNNHNHRLSSSNQSSNGGGGSNNNSRHRRRRQQQQQQRRNRGYSAQRTTTKKQQQQQQQQQQRSRRRFRRNSSNVAYTSDDENIVEREKREEVELLQEVINRRLKRTTSEATAKTNRALLERLLMRNAAALPLINGGLAATRCYEGRRAWSANPSRSVGGTPICLRRRVGTTTRQHQQQHQQLQHHQQQEQRKAVELPRRQVYSPPATRSASIFERNHQVYPASGPSSLGAMTAMSASELALIEADREADLKYAQLILEAERMLVSAQRHFEDNDATTTPCSSRASCYNTDSGTTTTVTANSNGGGGNARLSNNNAPPNPPPRNKRVESIKNAELNIELALSRSRNSQPELACGSIKDLLVDHSHHNHNYSSSLKRLLQQQQKKMIEQSAVATKTTQITDHRRFNDIESIHHHQQYSCPQSEPLKRKVYNNNNNDNDDNEGQPSSLTQSPSSCLQTPSWLRSSDGDCADLQSQTQQQYSQLQRKQMLIETLRGLKRSLEDQSAALKQSCLRPI